MHRVVLDTNVLVSAVISDGKSRDLLKKAIAHQFLMVTSDLILNEFTAVMRWPKFCVSEGELQRTISALKRTAEVVTVKTKLSVVRADPKDDMVVETAVDGSADFIVTGDNHLLAVGTYKFVKVVTIEDMLAILNDE
jgi:uncharacterized protein